MKAKFVALFMLIINTSLFAQTVLKGNINSWLLINNRIIVSDHWSFTNELHERTAMFLHQQGQFLIRPSIDFHPNKSVEVSVGYSFIHVWPYQPYSLPVDRSEHNMWTQALLKFDIGKVHFQNRLRQENRWVDHLDKTSESFVHHGSDFANRFRYRFTVTFDLINWKEKQKGLFLNVFDEFWFNQQKNLLPTDFARNWISLGLGFRFNKLSNLQLALMHQYDKVGPEKFIGSQVIQMTFIKNLDLRKPKPI